MPNKALKWLLNPNKKHHWLVRAKCFGRLCICNSGIALASSFLFDFRWMDWRLRRCLCPLWWCLLWCARACNCKFINNYVYLFLCHKNNAHPHQVRLETCFALLQVHFIFDQFSRYLPARKERRFIRDPTLHVSHFCGQTSLRINGKYGDFCYSVYFDTRRRMCLSMDSRWNSPHFNPS